VSRQRPLEILESIGPHLSRGRDLDGMPFDLPVSGPVQFENLAGLFASTSFDHGAIAMPVRQAAYIFGLIRQTQPKKVLEIGRYKGGSTFVIASAMAGQGQFWSIDLGEKESRLRQKNRRPYDAQLKDMLAKHGLPVTLLVGDSRTIEVDTGELDLAFIDGDHSYEGVKNDFERFGRRVRIGGAVLFDDAASEGLFTTHSDTVGRLIDEIVATGTFKLVKNVNRLAHIERVKADR
jgi:predicted O-methyltransferase YrrM